MADGPYQVTDFRQTPKTVTVSSAVSVRGINFVRERETTQTIS